MKVMKPKNHPVSFSLCVLLALTAWPAAVPAADAPKTPRPSIYDEAASGSKQIEEALAKAKKENKHVLLQFGANWCGWCHKLHGLFQSDKAIAEQLKGGYVVVMVDVNNGHNQDIDVKYGHPMQFGLPAIVVLDGAGQQLTTQDTGKLEEGDHHSS